MQNEKEEETQLRSWKVEGPKSVPEDAPEAQDVL